jgi:hypothetical protein
MAANQRLSSQAPTIQDTENRVARKVNMLTHRTATQLGQRSDQPRFSANPRQLLTRIGSIKPRALLIRSACLCLSYFFPLTTIAPFLLHSLPFLTHPNPKHKQNGHHRPSASPSAQPATSRRNTRRRHFRGHPQNSTGCGRLSWAVCVTVILPLICMRVW